jgi:hypothetical protein
MEEFLKPYIFYPITVIVAVIYCVSKVPKEGLADWWKLLALGLLWIFALSIIGSMVGYGAPELLTFRVKGIGAAALRSPIALGYILLFVGCGLLLRTVWHGPRGSRGG